jgi:hypothetical protein
MTEENFGRYYHIIEEIKSGSVGFSFTSIVHENRAMNKESNDQARQELSQTLGHHVWFIDLLEDVCIPCYLTL